MIKNIVLEGCGVKGVAFYGAILALEERNLLADVKNIIGSSAGSIIALALAINLSSADIKEILNDADFNKFLDKRWGVFNKLYHFITNYGMYKGDYFFDYIGKILEKYTCNKDLTFKELFDQYGNNLVITGTNVDKGIVEYFNHENNPDMPVRLAVRISISIPFIFEAVKYNGDLFVDGGVLENYPFNYFKDYDNTIGFKLVGNNSKRDNIINHYNHDIRNIKDYSLYMIKALSNQIERLHISDKYWSRTITINSLGIDATDFDLSESHKEKLILEGYTTTKDFIKILYPIDDATV
jgi:NTE family protein